MQLKVPLKHAEHDHVKREPGGPSPDERKLQNNFRTGWSTQAAPGTPSPRVSEGRPSPADPEPTLSIFPDQLHIGDRFSDAETGDEPQEWEVASRPVTYKQGHEVRARVQR